MLRESVIDIMAVRSAEALLENHAVRGIDRSHLVSLLRRTLHEEDLVEKKLNDEAERLLAANAAALKSAKADVGEMRRKIVQKLAAERGLVLR